jgi:hypothetical protein
MRDRGAGRQRIGRRRDDGLVMENQHDKAIHGRIARRMRVRPCAGLAESRQCRNAPSRHSIIGLPES